MRWAAAVLACAVAWVACGEAERPAGPAGAVTVRVLPTGEASLERTRRIDCPRSDLCPRLARADFELPANQACTEIYGGPATATVRGAVEGRTIAATFSLVNGCAIDHWQQFAWLLGPPPSPQGAERPGTPG